MAPFRPKGSSVVTTASTISRIFILYPATILKHAGYQLECKDFPAGGRTIHDFNRFCKSQDFDVIFFYSVFLSKRTDMLARDLIHRRNRATKFVFMATEPTANPDEFIDENSIVIRGEPETRVLPIIDSLEQGKTFEGLGGISYMKGWEKIHAVGSGVINDLDKLPFPDRTLLDSREYNNPKLSFQPFTTMVASRGCRFNCYYCVPNSLSFAREMEYKREKGSGKPPVRLRTPENVIAEFTQLAEEGYRSISFIDDQFVWGAGRTLKI